MWWRSATSIAISSRMLPPGWMMAVTPACAATWMPSGKGKYASTGHGGQRSALACLAQRDLDAHHARRLAGAHPDHGVLLGQHDRVRLDVAHRAPREQQVGQLLQGGAALGHHLELVAVLLQVVEGLDQQPASDALEVEVADPHLRALDVVRAAPRRSRSPSWCAGSRAPPACSRVPRWPRRSRAGWRARQSRPRSGWHR